MQIQKQGLIIASTAISYVLLFQLNTWLFSSLDFATGVNWIFLPSGLRLVFILVFLELGAAGIVIGSVAISMSQLLGADWVTAMGAGLISGFSPWLARLVCIDRLKLDINLNLLSTPTLLKVAMVFSVLSAVMHQLWFTWRGQSGDFLPPTAVMALGDLIGTVLVLYAAKFLLSLIPLPRKFE